MGQDMFARFASGLVNYLFLLAFTIDKGHLRSCIICKETKTVKAPASFTGNDCPNQWGQTWPHALRSTLFLGSH